MSKGFGGVREQTEGIARERHHRRREEHIQRFRGGPLLAVEDSGMWGGGERVKSYRKFL